MRNEQLKELARSLAAELTAADFPNIWRVKVNRGSWWEEVYTRDAWLHLSADSDRLRVTADRPRGMERAESAESITVNASRPPQDITRDIVRRILPHARAHFEKCHRYSRQLKEERKAHAKLIEAFKPYTRFVTTNSDGRHSTINTHGARFEIYNETINDARIYKVTPAQLLQILAILEPPQEADPIPTDELHYFELSELTDKEITAMVD